MIEDAIFHRLEDELLLKDIKLNSLLEITKSINDNMSVENLVSIYTFILKEQLGFQRFVMFHKDEHWKCLIKEGYKGRVKDVNVEEDLLRFKEITVIESSHIRVLNDFDFIVPIIQGEHALAFLLIAGFEDHTLKPSSTLANLSFIQTLTNIIAVAIENKRLAKEELKQERIRKDLEVAREMQRLLFPSHLPSDKRIDLAATYKSRHEVGGDYYDFIRISDDEFIVCIGDVSGKGIGAAMLMASFQATLRTLISLGKLDLKYLIHALNEKVMQGAKGEKFITFFIGRYNSKTRKFTYINAGHNHPFITNGKVSRSLDKGCIGLGMLEEIPFLEQDEVEITSNSTLVLYTDGVVELENEEGEFFEMERLKKLIRNYYPLNMEDLNNLLFSKLDEWRGKKDYVDDTAIFSCRIF
ncbi:sigma-B regulation protein RsbU (phosphoserine phosphatase) [Lishizhenia tianjinensis]|uniref:Sigma-B regulation protein RsbU (Phosphoserine phosphatase) n=1 Tax=Lishizhenia tianjinensis TaxID=477690 RepID=A0A1I7A0W0_9FLAO|nr:PP2C family protein-serine/threonine phosphatase [Lishizhenia tianjinensis]SFT68532.1 sigma-B regulation protein RsbU (phosphoserine phosphatase) [Lishizhenia tianjinensis]